MSLQKSLRRASHLARCDHAITKLRDDQPLEPSEFSWTFNMFTIDLYSDEFVEDRGKISFLLYQQNKDCWKQVYALSDKIIESVKLSKEDWNFILDGLIFYRRYLLEEATLDRHF